MALEFLLPWRALQSQGNTETFLPGDLLQVTPTGLPRSVGETSGLEQSHLLARASTTWSSNWYSLNGWFQRLSKSSRFPLLKTFQPQTQDPVSKTAKFCREDIKHDQSPGQRVPFQIYNFNLFSKYDFLLKRMTWHNTQRKYVSVCMKAHMEREGCL